MECKKKNDENCRQRDWCFTFHDMTLLEKEFNFQHQLKLDVDNKKVKYFIMGIETCPTTNKQHIQGYIYWTNARTFSAVKKEYPTAHIEPRQAPDVRQAADYCKKENNYLEYGELPVNPQFGKVNEWKEIVEDIKNGMTLEDLTIKYPEASIRYCAGIKNMYELHRPKHKFSILEKYGKYNEIQESIISYVEGLTHDREIYWVYDPKGGAGKTDLANHLISNNNFLVFGNAKTADVALAWNGENVIFDYSRSQQDHINYGVIEDIKNGRIFSGKYQSCTKLYARPKVLVFANFLPEFSKMSADRWNIQKIEDGQISAGADY